MLLCSPIMAATSAFTCPRRQVWRTLAVMPTIRLLFPATILIFAGNLGLSHAAICEPVRIPMCTWLPYNMTRMPNLLYHSTQRNAILVIEQYQALVDTNCSDSLLFFLCAMFAPMCPMGFNQDIIPPCRADCEKARDGCEPILTRYNLSWPEDLRCQQLPRYEKGVCITPDSILPVTPGKSAATYTNCSLL